eukprot:9766052-Alexandrium_andersonii.AAC.1
MATTMRTQMSQAKVGRLFLQPRSPSGSTRTACATTPSASSRQPTRRSRTVSYTHLRAHETSAHL